MVMPDSSNRFSLGTPAAVALLFLPVVITGFLILFHGSPYALYGDNLVQNLPIFSGVARDWAGGHLPLWTPYIFGGQPLLANPIAGALYPPYWLPFLMPIPKERVLDISFLFHLLVASTGMYLLLRAYGCRRIASIIGATIYSCSGVLHLLGSACIQMQAAASWAPFVLYFAWRLGSGPGFRPAFMLSLMLWIQFQCGYPQYSLCTGTIAGLYLMGSLIKGPDRHLVAWSLCAFIMGLLLVLPQSLLTLETMGVSSRHIGLGAGAGISFKEFMDPYLTVHELCGFLMPGIELDWFGAKAGSTWLYPGLAALLGMAAVLPRLKRPLVSFYFILFLIFVALSLGPDFFWQRWMYHLPVYNLFRGPMKHVFGMAFSLSILSSLGIDSMGRKNLGKARAIVLILLLFTLSVLSFKVRASGWPLFRIVFGAGVALCLFILTLPLLSSIKAVKWKASATGLVPILLVVTMAEAALRVPSTTRFLDAVFKKIGQPQYLPRERGFQNPIGEFLARLPLPKGRFLAVDGQFLPQSINPIPFDRPVLFQVPALHGYGPTLPRWLNEGLDMNVGGFLEGDGKAGILRARRWIVDLLNTRYIFMKRDKGLNDVAGILRHDIQGLLNIRDDALKDYVLVENLEAQGMAFFVKGIRRWQGQRPLLEIGARDPAFIRHTAYIAPFPVKYAKKMEAGKVLYINWTRDNPAEIRIGIKTRGASFLVVSLPYDAHWHVSMGGTPVRTYMVDGIVTGIFIPGAIKTELVFNYELFG